MSEPSTFRMIGYFREALLIFLQCRAISLSVGVISPNQQSSSNSLIDDTSISNGERSPDSIQSFLVYHTSRLPLRIVLCFCGTNPPLNFSANCVSDHTQAVSNFSEFNPSTGFHFLHVLRSESEFLIEGNCSLVGIEDPDFYR